MGAAQKSGDLWYAQYEVRDAEAVQLYLLGTTDFPGLPLLYAIQVVLDHVLTNMDMRI